MQRSNTARTRSRQGVILIEVVVAIIAMVIIFALVAATTQQARHNINVTRSMVNLKNFGVAHATYSSEWNGRQLTTCPDDLAVIIGADGTFADEYSEHANVPPVPLGFTTEGNHISIDQAWAIQPYFAGERGDLGAFRAFNTNPFSVYLNERVYDESFWAPADRSVPARLQRNFDDPGEWPLKEDHFFLSTYAASPAGMMRPDVWTGEAGVDPRTIPSAFRSPALGSCMYPDLKTHMLEHEWLQNAPESAMIPDTNLTWAFNHSPKSIPATLFYDGHVRLMPAQEAISSSARVVEQGGEVLWTSGAGGVAGDYLAKYALDQDNLTSYHVFTRNGIRGRDTIGEGAAFERPTTTARNVISSDGPAEGVPFSGRDLFIGKQTP